jgi:four helix bundle protein
MFDFQKLEVYRKAKSFHISSKAILSSIKTERFVNDQLGRASYSIVLNIAEGSAKVSKADRRNYFITARGSVFECVAIVDLLFDEKLIDETQHNNQLQLADEISRLLYAMIKNLKD